MAYQQFGSGSNSILFITSWLQNLDVMWDEPTLARYLSRLGSLGKVLIFDKRGSGVSDPVPLSALPTIEQWMDDARVAMDASGVEKATVIGDTEGGPIAILFAATYPERVSSLVLINTFARWKRDSDYPIGMPEATVQKLTDRYEDNWGTTSEVLGLMAPGTASDARFKDWYLRYQRLAMPRGAGSTMYRWVTDLDVREVLPTIHAPTLVVSRSGALHHRPQFGRFLADHIDGARYVELPGADTFPLNAGEFDLVLDVVEEFLTGAKAEPVLDRVLGTILFTGPGEILVSGTVKDLVLGSGIEFADRGSHSLRGVPNDWQLFEAVSVP